MNYSNPNIKYESTFSQMYVFLVLFTFFAFYHERCVKPKLQKKKKFNQKYVFLGDIVVRVL